MAEKHKERTKMGKGYKFTDKKHSLLGIISTIIGIIAVGLIVYSIYISFKADGNGGILVGQLGTVGFICAIIGMIIGLVSFKNDDVFYMFCWMGSILNILVVLFTTGMIMIGI